MLHSIKFKTISLLVVSSTLFLSFIYYKIDQTFNENFKTREYEKIAILTENISPSIALNISYNFTQAIEEIAEKLLKNDKILLIQIQNKIEKTTSVFSNDIKTLSIYKTTDEFIYETELRDPVSKEKIATLSIVYSSADFKANLQNFHAWFYISIGFFAFSLIILTILLAKSLNPLNQLAKEMKNFNPKAPTPLTNLGDSQDEINSIATSANTMINNINSYLDTTKILHQEILKKESHLKEAQRIANVGSWEYDVIAKKLTLSDEIYRILGINTKTKIDWEYFLSFIEAKDFKYISNSFTKAVENGSNFNLKYSVKINNKDAIDLQTRGKVRKKMDGSVKITAVSMDITKENKNKLIIEELAYYDSLTKLPNRTLLKNRLLKAMQSAKRSSSELALLFLDLDHFKLINDSLGHDTGDKLLIYVAQLLKSQLRESDTVARIGGDEFVILLPDFNTLDNLYFIASKLVNALRGQHNIEHHQLYITTSLGISIYPKDGDNIEMLMANADTAMYDAKKNGRNTFKLYSKDMGNHISIQMQIEQDLRNAIKNKNELEIYYQAKIDTLNGFISGAEALIRWNHPTNGLMFPDEFISIAESTGMMIDMGAWIIEECISQVKKWNQEGLVGLKIAINLSARQFEDTNLIPLISTLIAKHKIDPSQLEFEITETLSMSNIETTLRTLTYLKNLGVSIAIDDFGTGYSSLSYLKKFPINTLKIDQSFVMDMVEDEGDKVIVQTIITMAHSLGFKTVAEGVETNAHAKMLHELECDQLQGYYFSKPIPKEEFESYLRNYIPYS